MRDERRLRWLMLALLAPAGVCAGHCLGYAFAIPDPIRRAKILEETGHPWFAGQVVPASLAIGLGVIFALLVVALQRDAKGRELRRRVCLWLASRLALAQLVGFALFEVVERVAVGAPLDDLIGAGILKHGAAAQVAVALLLSGAVWLIALAVEHLRAQPVSWSAPIVATPVLAVGRPQIVPQRRPVLPRKARAPPAFS